MRKMKFKMPHTFEMVYTYTLYIVNDTVLSVLYQ